MTLGKSSATFPAVLQMGGVKTSARFPSSKYFQGSGTGGDSQDLQCIVLDLKRESRCKFNSFFSIRPLCVFVFHGITGSLLHPPPFFYNLLQILQNSSNDSFLHFVSRERYIQHLQSTVLLMPPL